MAADALQQGSLLHARFPGLVDGTWVEAGIDLFAILVVLVGEVRFVAGFCGPRLRVANA